MDATRAEIEFTAEVCQIAIDEGATTINIPDTVGYTMPHEYTAFLGALYELVPDLRDVVLSVHCHDDLGLAVANSFAGLLAGARQVECAINGIGERAGNASLEEIVMLLHTRRADIGLHTGAVTRRSRGPRGSVSRLTGYAVQPNKAIVGRNAFAHESGIHQDGVLKERTTYEIMDATTVGLEANSIVLGKHSGRHALQQALSRARLRGQRAGAEHRVQALQGDRRQEEAGHRDGPRGAGHRRAARGDRRLPARVVRGRGVLARPPHATVGIRTPDGESSTGSFTGDGPVDAIFHAINAATGHDARSASSASTRSPAARTRSARPRSCSSSAASAAPGQGVSTDILEAAGVPTCGRCRSCQRGLRSS
jgi:2-isopropylmalate synthase